MKTPCPGCEERKTPLKPGNAPLPECACRICRWLRDNATYEGPRRGR